MLLPKDEADDGAAYLEIRAGAGGDEAAIFAADLFRMYSRLSERQGWKVEVVNIKQSEPSGLKEAVVKINGQGVFKFLKFESGVHRVQRVLRPNLKVGFILRLLQLRFYLRLMKFKMLR